MSTHQVRSHVRSDGSVVKAHTRRGADGHEISVEQAGNAKAKALAAAEAENSVVHAGLNAQELAWQVGHLLSEEFVPAALGKLKTDHNGIYRPKEGNAVIERAKRLGEAVGIDQTKISAVEETYNDLAIALHDEEIAHQAAKHDDEAAIRRACDLYLTHTNASGGDLYEASQSFDFAWSDYLKELHMTAGLQMVRNGMIAGPDRHGDYDLDIDPEIAYDLLVDDEPEIATVENTTFGQSPDLAPPDVMEQLIEQGRKSRSDDNHQPTPVAKWTRGDMTWLVAEADADDPDRMFGMADLGMGHPEMGYISMSDVQSVGGVTRDVGWKPAGDLESYADAARTAGRIVDLPTRPLE